MRHPAQGAKERMMALELPKVCDHENIDVTLIRLPALEKIGIHPTRSIEWNYHVFRGEPGENLRVRHVAHQREYRARVRPGKKVIDEIVWRAPARRYDKVIPLGKS